MKAPQRTRHYSGIDYEHFLDDIRDMYPFGVEEAVLTELIANALDAKTTLIDIRVDPEHNVLELTDTGSGMDKSGFETYHNFSTSFKRKGHGIGFAGLGAKLALRIADSVVTETRSRNFWGSSEWRFERKGKTALPVWYDVEQRTLTQHGTRIRVNLKHKTHALMNDEEVRRLVLRHYLPLMVLHEFYSELRIYPRITVLVNGELLEAGPVLSAAPPVIKHYLLHRGAIRRPFALAHFELHATAVPEDMQGIAIASFGKIIRREFFKQHFSGMEKVTGIIEAPELVECLTTNKCDFRKDGTAGKKYYRFHKVAQQEFRRWLEGLHLVGLTEARTNRDVQQLQRTVNWIMGDMPELQHFYGFRGEREGLVADDAGDKHGSIPEPLPGTGRDQSSDSQESEEPVDKTLEEISRSAGRLEEGGDVAALKRERGAKFGPSIKYVSQPDRSEMSWMEGDTLLINTAHPTSRKAGERKVVEYHNLVAAALAMLREVPTATERIELLERFLGRWGQL